MLCVGEGGSIADGVVHLESVGLVCAFRAQSNPRRTEPKPLVNPNVGLGLTRYITLAPINARLQG